VEIALPYFLKIAPNKDATITPHLYTSVLPMLETNYRQLTSLGAYQVGAFVTHGSRIDIDPEERTPTGRNRGIRAYLEGNGKFQLDPRWSVTAAGRYVTDRTFLRRYDISRDDRLRSFVDAERITSDSYISLAGWAFQGLRLTDVAGQQPIALPAIDARWRMPEPIWGGRVELQANSPRHPRTEGQDTQRAFAAADGTGVADPLGQELLLTAFARGDVYHTDDTGLTPTVIYRGEEGWRARGIGALAAEMRWPLIGQFLTGTHRLTPRLQLVASPPHAQSRHSNEDARSVDLEDSNLFALNRFPGPRSVGRRHESHLRRRLGRGPAPHRGSDQYRAELPSEPPAQHLPRRHRPLRAAVSDVVGRTSVRFGRRLNLVHRFQARQGQCRDPPQRARRGVRRRQTYATIGYLRLDRNIDPAIEDLRDREEIRLGGRYASQSTGRCSDRPWSISPAAARTRSPPPTATSRCGTGSASPTTTNVSRLALLGGATMRRPGTFEEATASCSGWASRIWAAKLAFSKGSAYQPPALIGGMMKLGTFRSSALVLAGSLLAAAGVAQTASGPQRLNIPANPQFLGSDDPSIRKATAIVNGHVITGTDLDQRLALTIYSIRENGGEVTPEELQRLRLQVLRNLVDETLQIQAAQAKDIKVDQKTVDRAYEDFAKNFKRTPEQLSEFLRSLGSSEASVKRQIRGEYAWVRLQRNQIQPFVNISEDEVKSVIDRLQASKGQQKYKIGEIFMAAPPERAAETRANLEKIVQQIRQGAPFVAYARQFSEASTAAVGGDLGWVTADQLPPALAEAARSLPVGQVSNPIQVDGGYSLLVVQDTRQELMPDARDAVLSLKQMRISFPKGMTEEQSMPLVQRLVQTSQAMGGCGRVEEAAATIGAEVVSNDQVVVRDLPPKLQEMLLKLNVGQSTTPFGTLSEGVSVLTLCGRDDPANAAAPTFDQVYAQLSEAQMNLRARRLLRDLRRDAVVEYR
jgi:parvulin-like peptidyl-prolyl isomerase